MDAKRAVSETGPARNLISDKTLRSITNEWRIDTELDLITARLHADPERWTKDKALLARRRKLLGRAGKPLPTRLTPHSPGDRELGIGITDRLWPWTVMNLPYMYDGIYEEPGIASTSGGISSGLSAGNVSFGANPMDSGGTNPHVEKWWIRNWRNSVVFPDAPHSGHLAYRFTVDSDYTVYRAPVYSGLARQFVTLGSTSSVISSPVAEWTNWHTVGWILDATFPNEENAFGGALPVIGSIPVDKGQRAALGFIYGMVMGVASGYFQSWGSIGTRRTVGYSTTRRLHALWPDRISVRAEVRARSHRTVDAVLAVVSADEAIGPGNAGSKGADECRFERRWRTQVRQPLTNAGSRVRRRIGRRDPAVSA